ncbi:MAG: hypothetical protein SFT91_05770 [Rickettsiaceae bacterium]|nr:hypothetical protein [Rickettsiaceae bacterium]
MRVNLYSLVLTLLTLVGSCKLVFLFDKVANKTMNLQTYATSLILIGEASAKENSQTNDKAKAEKDKSKGDQVAKSLEKDVATDGSIKPPGSTLNPESEASKQFQTDFLSNGYNEEEVKVLMELSKRREELDKYQQQLTLKESFLKATEDKLANKTKDLQTMEQKINNLMAQLEDKSNLRIKSLAKIYENMKATEAAVIFDELEMPLLLEIIRNMKEQKVAPIIAQMNPQKAKDISLEFARISDSIDGIKSR